MQGQSIAVGNGYCQLKESFCGQAVDGGIEKSLPQRGSDPQFTYTEIIDESKVERMMGGRLAASGQVQGVGVEGHIEGQHSSSRSKTKKYYLLEGKGAIYESSYVPDIGRTLALNSATIDMINPSLGVFIGRALWANSNNTSQETQRQKVLKEFLFSYGHAYLEKMLFRKEIRYLIIEEVDNKASSNKVDAGAGVNAANIGNLDAAVEWANSNLKGRRIKIAQVNTRGVAGNIIPDSGRDPVDVLTEAMRQFDAASSKPIRYDLSSYTPILDSIVPESYLEKFKKEILTALGIKKRRDKLYSQLSYRWQLYGFHQRAETLHRNKGLLTDDYQLLTCLDAHSSKINFVYGRVPGLQATLAGMNFNEIVFNTAKKNELETQLNDLENQANQIETELAKIDDKALIYISNCPVSTSLLHRGKFSTPAFNLLYPEETVGIYVSAQLNLSYLTFVNKAKLALSSGAVEEPSTVEAEAAISWAPSTNVELKYKKIWGSHQFTSDKPSWKKLNKIVQKAICISGHVQGATNIIVRIFALRAAADLPRESANRTSVPISTQGIVGPFSSVLVNDNSLGREVSVPIA